MENQYGSNKRPQKSRKIWSDYETEIFINIWSEYIEVLRKAKRNGHIIIQIVKRLESKKISVNVVEVLNKINNLSRKYRTEKKLMATTGVPTDWTFYEQIHKNIAPFKTCPDDTQNETTTVDGSSMDINEVPLKAYQKPRKVWSTIETKIFIDIWIKYARKLKKGYRTGEVIHEIAQELQIKNIYVDASEVLNKINNSKKRYRHEKKLIEESGGSPSDWQFYQIVHEIIHSKPKHIYLSEESIENSNFSVKIEDSCDSLSSELSDMSTPSASSVPLPNSQPLSAPLPITEENTDDADASFSLPAIKKENTDDSDDDGEIIDNTDSTIPVSSTPPPLPVTKKIYIDDYDEIKDIMRQCSKTIALEMKRSNDLLAEANEIETKKLKIIDNFVNSNISFQNSIIKIFQQEKK